MTKEFLKKRIEQQRDYIRSLAGKEFSTFERRLEVTDSAIQVLKRLERDLDKFNLHNALGRIAMAGLLTALFALVTYFALTFFFWSWDLPPIVYFAYRVAVVFFAFVMTKYALDAAIEEGPTKEETKARDPFKGYDPRGDQKPSHRNEDC